MEAAVAPYVAPELGDADAPPPPRGTRGDLYSLGVISYELLAGRQPSEGLMRHELEQARRENRPLPLSKFAPGVSLRVLSVIERALAKEVWDRPATAGEFMSELRDALGMKKAAPDSSSQILSTPREADAGASWGGDLAAERPRPAAPTRRPSPPAAEAAAAEKPIYTDENVQFTVYQPEAVAPARWYTLLALAHLSKQRPDAPPDEPEPLAEVKRIAARVLADEAAEYDAVKQNSLHAVPHKGEIRFVPDVEGCEFNPSSQSFSWQKSVHKVEFEMRAAASLDGRTARGRLTVFLGSLILADIPLAIRVDGASSAGEVPTVAASASPYRKIFPSYSHKDRAVVEQIEHHIHALGDKYLRDLTELRAGQDWQRWMRDAIREADVFQLFWSHNSMRSVYVRQEWEYALSLGRQNFVRPTYWETPLPESATENLPPVELRRLHFQHLRANTIVYHPAAAAATSDEADYSQTQMPRPGHAGAVAAARPGGDDLVCAGCGGRNSPEKAFCQTCAMSLSAPAQERARLTAAQSAALPTAAQPTAQSAETPAQEPGGVLDIFWEKRPREHQQGEPLPALPYTSE
ncbi:MAG TPA: TIR domain-containing protein, partial [Pyrinomonadaceae bacterium]